MELTSPLLEAMEGAGITADMLAGQLAEELKASETKFFSFRGQVIEARIVPNWEVRQRARMDAHKLRGDYAPERVNLNMSGSTGYSEDDQATLQAVARELAMKKLQGLRDELDTVDIPVLDVTCEMTKHPREPEELKCEITLQNIVYGAQVPEPPGQFTSVPDDILSQLESAVKETIAK
jgi:hypothetical protein